MRSHWAANCFCERLAIIMVSTNETGTVSRQIAASNGLMVSIMMSTPTIVRAAVISCVRLCCSD